RSGLDFGHFTRGERGFHSVDVVVDEAQVDGLIFYANHVLEQIATHALGKMLKREALLDIGAAVHNEHSFHRVRGMINVAQGIRGAHYAHHAHPIQAHAIPRTFGDLPPEYRQPACETDLGIGEAGSGVYISQLAVGSQAVVSMLAPEKAIVAVRDRGIPHSFNEHALPAQVGASVLPYNGQAGAFARWMHELRPRAHSFKKRPLNRNARQ